jgi:hypothetical protein
MAAGLLLREGLLYKNRFWLEQRYNKFASLLENKKYSELYKLYSSDFRSKTSEEEFVKSYANVQPIGKQNITINNITISNNNGYIDRTNVYCKDSNCKNKTTLRGYKKWVFEGGNWYYSSEDPYCIRTAPYNTSYDITNALTLIRQKSSLDYGAITSGIENCIEITPINQNGVEDEVFTFDKNNSSPERLKINFDTSSQISNDALKAFLLIPAISQAKDFIYMSSSGTNTGCHAKQVGAILNQALFITGLEAEEYASMLNTKVDNRTSSKIKNISNFSSEGMKTCNTGSWRSFCYSTYMTQKIGDMITNDPYYQEKCKSSN